MTVSEEIATATGYYQALAGAVKNLDFSATELLSAGFFVILFGCIYREARRPFLRRGVQALMQSYRTNFATFFLNDLSLWLLSVPSLYFVADRFSSIGLLSAMPDGPAKFLLCFVLLDFVLYAWHFAMHHDDGLWVFHKLHHSDRSLNVTTGLRYDLGELILEVIVRAIFLIAIGVSAEMMLVCQAVISFFVLIHHTNTSLPAERWLGWVIIVPRLHRIHHSVRREEHDSNYGAVFSVWDRLFGTLKEQEPAAIGLLDEHQPRWLDWLRDWIFAHDERANIPVPVRSAGSRQAQSQL